MLAVLVVTSLVPGMLQFVLEVPISPGEELLNLLAFTSRGNKARNAHNPSV